jgi:hypothetical protein
MKTLLRTLFLIVLLSALSSIATAQNSYSLNRLTTFGPSSDGHIEAPSSDPVLDIVNDQRGLSVDPISGNLVFVDTHSGSGGSSNVQGSIYIVHGTYGTNITTLNTNGMLGGNYADVAAAVADDGVVFVCNQVTASSTSPFIIYRWDSVTSTLPPTIAFSGTLAPSQRYGTSIDIRGSGAGTQIIIGSMPGGSATNVVIFTTVNGLDFTAHVLRTDVTVPAFRDGVAFGTGDTFWAKSVGTPLLLMGFDLSTNGAFTLKSYDSSALANSATLGPISVDLSRNLLAAIDVFDATRPPSVAGPEHVRLYDITNPNVAPSILDIEDYAPNNANATAPPGYVDFGNGKLYSHVVNNGLMAFTVDSAPMPAPIINSQPPATNRVIVGRTVLFSVSAYPLVGYQWRSNNVDIAGATNSVYSLTNVQVSYSGYYSCFITNASGSATVTTYLEVVNPSALYHLNRLWSATAGTTTGSGDQPYILYSGAGNVPNQRQMAYYAASNILYLVHRSSSTTSNYVIYAINGTNGTPLYNLNTNGIVQYIAPQGGASGLALDGIGVGEDGAVYACTETPNASGSGTPIDTNKFFRLYRWANGNTNTVPVQIFEGDPATQSSAFRWGDNMTVRGSGINTQIILDNNDAASRYICVFTPTDGSLLNWSNHWFFGLNTNGAGIGRSLEFGIGSTFWQKRRGSALVQSSFDLSLGFPSNLTATNAIYPNFPANVYGVGLDNSPRQLAAGVSTNSAAGPDSVDLYDVSDPVSPLLIQQFNFGLSPRNPNANNISHTFFSGDLLFSLDANNGIMVFRVAAGPPTAPVFVVQPESQRVILGGTATFSITTDQQALYQWQFQGGNISGATTNSYTVTNAQLSNVGGYRCVATNQYGANTSLVANLTVSLPQDNYSLSNLWSLAPASRSYLTSNGGAGTPKERTIAYNALSNEVYIISRTVATAENTNPSGLTINVLDASTGADLHQLDTNGIAGGSFDLIGIGVGNDGSIYAGNVDSTVTNHPSVFRLYRWTNSASSTPPVLVYSGEPADAFSGILGVPVRWGDALAVRGSGLNTEVVLDANQGVYLAVLSPLDSSLNAFTNKFAGQSGVGSPIGRSLQFGSTNTVWQKRSGLNLRLSSYDLTTHSSAGVRSIDLPASLGPVALDFSRNIMAGIDFATNTSVPDTVALYDVSDINNPMLIANYAFPANHKANDNLIGQVVVSGNRVWALDGNNGVAAFTINDPPLDIVPNGSSVIVSWPLFSGFTLQATPSLGAPITWTNVGTGTVVGGRYTLTNPAPPGSLFYRLHH